MADANARLEFLWKASHMLLAQSPGASSHYMSQFLSMASDRDLRLHEDIQTRSCAGCGSIFVPGVNAQVRIVPVAETKIEREKRKRVARKKAKMERSKAQKEDKDPSDKDRQDKDGDTSMAEADEKEETMDTIPPLSSSELGSASETAAKKKKPAKDNKRTQQPDPKNIIRITPYTEMARQETQQQQQMKRRMQGHQVVSAKKSERRANQVLNHVYYSCKRCHRETELDGTKEGYLNSRIKTSNMNAAQRAEERKIRKLNRLSLKDKDTASPASVVMASAVVSPSNNNNNTRSPAMASLHSSAASSPQARNISRMASPHQSPHIGGTSSPLTKRPSSPMPPQSAPMSNLKKTKYSASMPVSPVGGLSLASSATSSAATSPASSPRIPSLGGAGDKMGGGGGNNKKKKKQNLASLLANQKAKDSDNNNGGPGASSGSDSALASFLMGL